MEYAFIMLSVLLLAWFMWATSSILYLLEQDMKATAKTLEEKENLSGDI